MTTSKRSRLLFIGATLLVAAAFAAYHAASGPFLVAARDTDELTEMAFSKDRRYATAAIAELRARGPAALEALLVTHASTFDAHGNRVPWPRFREAVDQVAQQRDAHAAKLYWYTDLSAAIAAADGKPILSLRLLGKLSEELSCANSRFFRAVLYPNEEVANLLRERFVLHWQSVRPAPRLTIDFGDGRSLETTITGNSIHYVLAPDGRPIDAMPGLYGATEFVRGLERAAVVARRYAELPVAEAEDLLTEYHQARLVDLDLQLRRDLLAVGVDGYQLAQVPSLRLENHAGSFSTWPQGTKNRVELPIIRSLIPGTNALQTTIDDAIWRRLAHLYAPDTALDERSRALIRQKKIGRASADVGSKDEARVAPMFLTLERTIAEDQVRNEQVYHRAIHSWFADGTAGSDLDRLNARVYRDLFLADTEDGWLGMVPPDSYDGIDSVVRADDRS